MIMMTSPTLRKALAIAGLCVSLAASAHAGFSLQLSAGALTDTNGANLDSDSLVLLVVDLNGDGVMHPDQSSFTPGSDDIVLGTTATQSLGSLALASDQIVRNDITLGTTLFDGGPTIDADDPVAMFWFPDITEATYLGDGSLQPGDTTFGAYNTTSSTVDVEWVIPSEGQTVDLRALTSTLTSNASDLDGSVLQAQFSTGGVMIPEPSSAILALLGSGFLCFRRRRS